jgi:hypothetical protein
VQDLHWAAHYLNSLTNDEQMHVTLQEKVFQILQRYDIRNPHEAVLQFAQYRNAAGEFF